jgi:glycosyltransferase involved in cell wall biosynthesis
MGSYHFSPDVGGIETASALLATEWAALGQEVRLVTETAQPDSKTWPFKVIRRPTRRFLLEAARWADVFFQNNISLHSLWAAFLSRKPWVVTHQTWITRVDGELGWRDRLKRFLLRFATNIAISESIARDVGVQCHRIGNPYQPDIFKLISGAQRSRELVFLGRLVSDKGLDILIKALAVLRTENFKPRLTVIGSGPEEGEMRELAAKCQVLEQIEFLGQRTGLELAGLLNSHEIMVVPSRWDEPFGIVALEGIACGCVVVGSENGGLREAIGPCGLTFPNEGIGELAAVFRTLLGNPERCESLRSHREKHLVRFEAGTIAREYLRVFEAVVR